jgi:hypothetical protein
MNWEGLALIKVGSKIRRTAEENQDLSNHSQVQLDCG